MARIEEAVICDGCGVEITWASLIVKGREYCCKDCLEGRGCDCAERVEWDDERRGRVGQAGYNIEGG